MSLSSFALILGVLYYAFGFPLVFNEEKHLEWRMRMMKNENLLRYTGILFVIITLTVLRHHFRMTWDAEGFVILVAWIGCIKSILVAFFPAWFAGAVAWAEDHFLQPGPQQVFIGFVGILIGALFTFLGFILV